MAKTIMISDDVYRTLTQLKHKGDSYTQVIARSLGTAKNQRKSLLECAGLWKHLSSEKIARMKKLVKASRNSWRELKW